MSHGVSFSEFDENIMVVTHYGGDNSVILQDVNPEIKKFIMDARIE